MPKSVLFPVAALVLIAAAPAPTLQKGFSRDQFGMCHKQGGAYVACTVAAPTATMQCKDGAFSISKIVKTGCNAHGGVRKVL